MKRCSICKIEKDNSEFNKNKAKKDGLGTVCRECQKARSKRYYRENIDKHRKEVIKRKYRNLAISKENMLNYLKGKKCADCGMEDYRVFEFDHINDDKFANVSALMCMGYSWENVKKEMDKCEIVCSNCHRLRTYTRQGNYRMTPP